jgi:mannitol/fructose-specific phosphotransferase system IIA component (Ntr-type)
MMKKLLYRPSEESVVALLRRGAFVPKMRATTPAEAIAELVGALRSALDDKVETARASVLERELMAPTGLGDEVAIPHAAVEGLTQPLLALGRAPQGIDFDAPDGRPAQIVFLLLMPPRAYEMEVRILASIARSIFDSRARTDLLKAAGPEEMLYVIGQSARRTEEASHGPRAASLADL